MPRGKVTSQNMSQTSTSNSSDVFHLLTKYHTIEIEEMCMQTIKFTETWCSTKNGLHNNRTVKFTETWCSTKNGVSNNRTQRKQIMIFKTMEPYTVFCCSV